MTFCRDWSEGEEMDKVDPETLLLLHGYTDDEWLTFFNALVIIAKKECKKRYWRTGQGGLLPQGHSPETIAKEAITRLFSGKRTWNQEDYPGPSPMGILRATVESIVGDLVRCEDHKRYAPLATGEDNGDSGDATQETDKLLQKAVGKQLVQPALLQDRLYEIQDVIGRIRDTIKDRADLVAYFDLYMQDLKRGEIAQRLGVKVDRVDELRKQFIERTLDVYREFFGGKQPANEKGARLARN
jgi:hypothetical protein